MIIVTHRQRHLRDLRPFQAAWAPYAVEVPWTALLPVGMSHDALGRLQSYQSACLVYKVPGGYEARMPVRW